jgi:uncharacterized protein
MSHRENRTIHDADSHLIETAGWLENHATDYVKENLGPGLIPMDLPALQPFIESADARVSGKTPELTEALKGNIFGHEVKRTQWGAYGAYNTQERSKALDIMGLSRQLVFPTLAPSRFYVSKDLELMYGGSEALNRAMVGFTAGDKRLMPVGYLPLHDPERSVGVLQEALKLGIKSMWIRTNAVEGRAPSHIAYDPLWAMMEEAGVPITLHIGSGTRLSDVYFNTGVERELEESLTNIESTRAKDLSSLHHSIERWLNCMIYDGVFERFPRLRVGIIELGSNWLPACLENLDYGVTQLGKFDVALKKLTMKPSEYMRRHVRVTPFHFENTGNVLRQIGQDILMFNTDYPHPEGGSDPYGTFENSLNAVNATDIELDHFYAKNFEYLMGL